MAWSRALRQLTSSSAKSAGRNSSGRITIFHRGGGAKRLQRTLDLKRNTSSMGVVERIEYDPNRSSKIALVRWEGGPHQRKRNTTTAIEEAASAARLRSTTAAATTVHGPFAFSSHFVTSKKSNCAKDVFSSAFLSTKANGETRALGGSVFGFPRVAVAGANPAFFVSRMRERVVGGGDNNTFSLSEIRTNSSLAHRIKRKAAISWQSFTRKENLGFVGASELNNQSKLKTDQGGSKKKNVARSGDWAPVTYVIASNHMEAGKKMLMNCSKSSISH